MLWSVNVRQRLRYAVVHGALGERQAANGAQPADAGTQVGGRNCHGVPPVQPATVHHVQRSARLAAGKPRGVRRPARAACPPLHGQRGQRQQYRVQRRHAASGHARQTAGEQAGNAEKVSIRFVMVRSTIEDRLEPTLSIITIDWHSSQRIKKKEFDYSSCNTVTTLVTIKYGVTGSLTFDSDYSFNIHVNSLVHNSAPVNQPIDRKY